MKKNKPLVFIIGGFGTKAGIDIINNLLIEYKKIHKIKNDADVINFILYSVTEHNNYNHFTYEQCYSAFLKIINDLNNFLYNNDYTHVLLCIGCNTMHICIQDYLKKHYFDKRIIFYSLPEYVRLHIETNYSYYNNYSSIYLLSSIETFNNKLYQNIIKNINFNNKINNYSLLAKIIIDIKCLNEVNLNEINDIIKEIPNNSIIILGCTELPIIENEIKNLLLDKNIIILNPHKIISQYISKDYLNIIKENIY